MKSIFLPIGTALALFPRSREQRRGATSSSKQYQRNFSGALGIFVSSKCGDCSFASGSAFFPNYSDAGFTYRIIVVRKRQNENERRENSYRKVLLVAHWGTFGNVFYLVR